VRNRDPRASVERLDPLPHLAYSGGFQRTKDPPLSPHLRHCLAAFCLDFALATGFMATPFFIYHELGGTAETSGTIGAFQSLFYGATCLLASRLLANAKNGLRWASLGAIGLAVFFGVAPMTHNTYIFATLTFVGVASMGFFWPAMQAWLGGERDPKLRGRRVLAFNLSWSAGLALAPLVAGPLYDRLFYGAPYVLLIVVGIAAAFLVRTLPREAPSSGVTAGDVEDLHPRYDERNDIHLYCGWIANMVGWAMMGITRSVFPRRVDELVEAGQLTLFPDATVLDLGAATQFSWLIATVSVARAFMFIPLGFSTRWQHRFWVLLLSQTAAALAFWVIGMTHSLVIMALCLIVVGANGGIAFFASLSYSIAHYQHRQRRAAIHESMVGLGSFIGAMSFGWLADRYGTPWPFLHAPWFMAVAISAQALMLAYGVRRARRTTALD
jgi:MFS family permease